VSESAFSWSDLVKKKATSIDDYEIGQIREVKADLVLAKRDSLNVKQYFLPKNLIVGFDRHSVYFRIMKGETETYRLH
jgi:hypothetical protein